jgi:hypothetical protein
MSSRAGAKECRLGGDLMDMAFPFQLLFRKPRREVLEKDWVLPEIRRKEDQPRVQSETPIVVVLKQRVKHKPAFRVGDTP